MKEIPKELLKGEIFEQNRHEQEDYEQSSFRRAKQAFRAAPTQYGSVRPDTGHKTPVYTPVSNQRSFSSAATQKTSLSYGVGDRVRHIKFGDGQVTAIVEGGRDYEVTVDFDKAGTKKMFASFAKLKKI